MTRSTNHHGALFTVVESNILPTPPSNYWGETYTNAPTVFYRIMVE